MSEPCFYLARDGQTYGPYPAASLQEMIESGNIAPTDQVCEQGTEDWRPVTQVFVMAEADAAPPTQPVAAPAAATAPVARVPLVTPEIVEALDKRYRGKLVATFLCLMLAVMPLVIKLDAKGRTEAQMLQEEAHGRHSGKKALVIILAKWWPVAMVVGAAGMVLFIRQAKRSRRELKAAEKQFKAQMAAGGPKPAPRPQGKPQRPRR